MSVPQQVITDSTIKGYTGNRVAVPVLRRAASVGSGRRRRWIQRSAGPHRVSGAGGHVPPAPSVCSCSAAAGLISHTQRRNPLFSRAAAQPSTGAAVAAFNPQSREAWKRQWTVTTLRGVPYLHFDLPRSYPEDQKRDLAAELGRSLCGRHGRRAARRQCCVLRAGSGQRAPLPHHAAQRGGGGGAVRNSPRSLTRSARAFCTSADRSCCLAAGLALRRRVHRRVHRACGRPDLPPDGSFATDWSPSARSIDET